MCLTEVWWESNPTRARASMPQDLKVRHDSGTVALFKSIGN